MENELKTYFHERKPLGETLVREVTMLTDGKSNSHLNFKVVTDSGIYVARVTKPGDVVNHSNLPDEYTILKLAEESDVGPRALHIDLEYFSTPLLIEEYVEGVRFDALASPSPAAFDRALDLFERTSTISITPEQYPFKYMYTTYRTNIEVCHTRLGEIANVLGETHDIVLGFAAMLARAIPVLMESDALLRATPPAFIYNDVHPGNLFWLPEKEKATFIDWQKVSLGDPAFMIALFARRFGHIFGDAVEPFSERVFKGYASRVVVNDLEQLFIVRMLERAVSDMIWSVWSEVKRDTRPAISRAEENKFYHESDALLSRIATSRK